jgi:hypothetical protein
MTKIVEAFTQTFNAQGARYVDMIAAGIESLAKWLETIDIGKLLKDFIDFAKRVGRIIGVVKELLPYILLLVAEIKVLSLAISAFAIVMKLVAVLGAASTVQLLIIIGVITAVSLAVMWLVRNWDKVVPVLKAVGSLVGGFFVTAWRDTIEVLKVVGGFFVNIGQTIMKWLLLPINMVVDSLSGLLGFMSKIPGMGKKLAPAIDAINSFQSGMNRTLTGTEGAADFGGVWKGNGYSNPDTRVAETRTSTSSTTRSEVFVRPDTGATVSTSRGGAPSFALSYGMAQ